jgi:hypothetical protein
MAYITGMRFVETPVFTRELKRLLDDESYRRLQIALILRPAQGVIIRGSGGLRKLRWAAPDIGKRGGLRVRGTSLQRRSGFSVASFGRSSSERRGFSGITHKRAPGRPYPTRHLEALANESVSTGGRAHGARDARCVANGVRLDDRCQRGHVAQLGTGATRSGRAGTGPAPSGGKKPEGGCRGTSRRPSPNGGAIRTCSMKACGRACTFRIGGEARGPQSGETTHRGTTLPQH